jgi:hypothetical protein
MYNRLLSFLTEINVITDNQFVLREKQSTYTALFSLTAKVTVELDTRNFSFGIFI